MNWYVAFAFCAIDGGRLPTEAEWEFAAAGGDEQRVYPWSIPATNATISVGQATTTGNQSAITRVGTTTGVGAFGHVDLAGNRPEWVRDQPSDLSTVPTCIDCAFVNEPDVNAVTKGGGIDLPGDVRNASYRAASRASTLWVGFRCARDL